MKQHQLISFIIAAILIFFGCKGNAPKVQEEDRHAKELLQGIWVNEDAEDVAFRAEGDTVYYPDSVSQPVYFAIVGDTFVLRGANVVKYPVVRQTEHLFLFRNQNGELVRLMKSDEPADAQEFAHAGKTVVLNQRQLIKRDTVVSYGAERYHGYVQVNPTSYKVIKASYNDEGVAVENVYYDNIIHLAVFRGGTKLFSSDFHKSDFSRLVPADFLKDAILNEMTFSHIDAAGIHYHVFVSIPDSPSNYMVEVTVDFSGKLKMKV